MSLLLRIAIPVVSLIALIGIVAALPPHTMWGPFLMIWLCVLSPLAFLACLAHPSLKTWQERRVFLAFAGVLLLVTYLVANFVALVVNQNWAGWVFFLPFVFFGALLWKGVRLRIALMRERHRFDREFESPARSL